jgi:transcription elongation regulator 1
MRHEWEAWLSKRTIDARADFQKLLEENSFVEFWGKVGKLEDANENDNRLVVPGEEDLGMSGGPAGVTSDDSAEGKTDLKILAKSITEKEIERVLKVCPQPY